MNEQPTSKEIAIPSAALLREWAKSADNTMCWGLDAIADELERLRRDLPETSARLVQTAAREFEATRRPPTAPPEPTVHELHSEIERLQRDAALKDELIRAMEDCIGVGEGQTFEQRAEELVVMEVGHDNIERDMAYDATRVADEPAALLSEYLKDGETAAECIERNRRDVVQSLGMLAAERKKVESLTAERDDWHAAYNRVALAARAVTAELQKVGDTTLWQYGDETDRVYAWHEMQPLAAALDADIHQSRPTVPPSGRMRETIYASDWLLSNLRGRTKRDDDAKHELVIEFDMSAPTKPACLCGHPYADHETPGTECAVEDCRCGRYRLQDETTTPECTCKVVDGRLMLDIDPGNCPKHRRTVETGDGQ